MKKYVKVWFECPVNGRTAGRVLPVCVAEKMSVTDMTLMFPYSDALKIVRLKLSPEFNSFEEAFAYDPEDGAK